MVFRAAVREVAVRTETLERAGRGGLRDETTGDRHEHHVHHGHDGLRIAASAGSAASGHANHAGAGQRSISEMRIGTGLGEATSDRVAVPAGVLAKPEPDRTTVEVRQEAVPERQILCDLSPNFRPRFWTA